MAAIARTQAARSRPLRTIVSAIDSGVQLRNRFSAIHWRQPASIVWIVAGLGAGPVTVVFMCRAF